SHDLSGARGCQDLVRHQATASGHHASANPHVGRTEIGKVVVCRMLALSFRRGRGMPMSLCASRTLSRYLATPLLCSLSVFRCAATRCLPCWVVRAAESRRCCACWRASNSQVLGAFTLTTKTSPTCLPTAGRST